MSAAISCTVLTSAILIYMQLEEKLKRSGYNVWIDKEQVLGSTIDSMQKGVINAAVFLLCMSEDYEKSDICR